MWEMQDGNRKWMRVLAQWIGLYWRKLPDGPWHGAGYDEA